MHQVRSYCNVHEHQLCPVYVECDVRFQIVMVQPTPKVGEGVFCTAFELYNSVSVVGAKSVVIWSLSIANHGAPFVPSSSVRAQCLLIDSSISPCVRVIMSPCCLKMSKGVRGAAPQTGTPGISGCSLAGLCAQTSCSSQCDERYRGVNRPWQDR